MADLDALLDEHPNVERTEETIELDVEAFLSAKARVEGGIKYSVGAVVTSGNGEVLLVKNWWSEG